MGIAVHLQSKPSSGGAAWGWKHAAPLGLTRVSMDAGYKHFAPLGLNLVGADRGAAQLRRSDMGIAVHLQDKPSSGGAAWGWKHAAPLGLNGRK
jgi:hypothetical protein